MSDLVINGALFTLLSIVIGGSIRLTWQISRVAAALTKAQEDHAKEYTAALLGQERRHQEELATLRREFGETVGAIRQKVHEFETWSRDEFVRKGSFELVIARMEKGIESLGDKIEKRLDKMAERMEKIGHE